MSIVLDLSADDLAALRKLADREQRSIEEVAILAIQARVRTDQRAALLDGLFDRVAAEDAELLDRLAQ